MNEFICENVVRWYEHFIRIDENRRAKRIYESECGGRRVERLREVDE